MQTELLPVYVFREAENIVTQYKLRRAYPMAVVHFAWPHTSKLEAHWQCVASDGRLGLLAELVQRVRLAELEAN